MCKDSQEKNNDGELSSMSYWSSVIVSLQQLKLVQEEEV
jgi:hypothetical protein